MLSATTPVQATYRSRKTNGTDNHQVLEFLQLVEELKQVAELLAIEPAGSKSSNKSHSKRVTAA